MTHEAKLLLIEYLHNIYTLPVHPIDDVRNSACLEFAKNAAKDCLDLLTKEGT